MISKLRRDMTIVCALITGVILIFMSIVSLRISEDQLEIPHQESFERQISDLIYRFNTESIVQWSWLSQAEIEGNLSLYIENNGSPLLYRGKALKGIEWSTELIYQFAEIAATMGVNTKVAPMSSLEHPKAFFGINSGTANFRVAVVTIRTPEGYISLFALGDNSEQLKAIERQRFMYLGLSAVCLLGLVMFSWWFSAHAVRPIAENRRRQSEFIAAASHELRTPIAVISASAAALGYEKGTQNERFVQNISRECTYTGKLIDELLTLANIDANGFSVTPESVDAELLLAECMEAFEPAALEKNINLTLNLPNIVLPMVMADEHRLRQAVSILLDNAVRYTPQYGKIIVSAGKQGRYVYLRVADNGPGIPKEEQNRVFERFYRADPSRSKKEHYGLGLSIAWEIARLSGGKIKLSDTYGGGLTADILMPFAARTQT